MAEEESDLESERFKEQLESLLDCGSGDDCGSQSKNYCTRFCALVEEQTGRWQVPLPQLQVLRTALCYFAHGTVTFPSDCEHVRYALSSLALSFFELLLFFGKDEFLEDPLKNILESFQECHSCLVRHKNVYLLLLKQIIKDGGPWENPVLQAILAERASSREEVERYLSSEVPVFFELRVRYLLACERIPEAVALAKSCIEHPEIGRHLYFHQAYLTCLCKASLYEHLHKEVAEIDGRDAVEIICNTESEERDDLLLALCKVFLTQQLQNGDMYYIWDLIFIWSKLHLRANPSKQDFLKECHQLMLSATNVKSIFPFMKVIRAELGNEGLQFCVELCARALQMDLHHDPVTKSLIYKTIAFLLPNDLEVCRACALLVFFLERTVESYKTVYLLYTHPDQEYHVDYSLIKNDIRFEILQILKKGLFFDPEFWNLITLRTNCLKLMSEKVMQAALNEIMEEDKWIPNYSVKEPPKSHSDIPAYPTNKVRRHPVRDSNKPVLKCIVVPPEGGAVPLVKRRGRKPGSRVIRVVDDSQLRRSFRQLDMAQENSIRQQDNRQQRLMARQVEKKTMKRRGRKPRWLLQEAARQAENSVPRRMGRPGRKKQIPPKTETKQPDHGTVEMSNEMDKAQEISVEEASSDAELTPQLSAAETANEESVHHREEEPTSLDPPVLDNLFLTPVPVTMLEVSIPDNIVMDFFSEDQGTQTQQLVDVSQQDSTPEHSVHVEDVSAEDPFTQSGDREEIPQTESPQNTILCALTPGPMTEGSEESVIEVNNDVIQQLHNYSRILVVEENVQSLVAVPKDPPSVQQESPCESADTVQKPSGEPRPVECEIVVEEAVPSQTPTGMAVCSEVDIAETERKPEAIMEGTEGVSQQETDQVEESCVTLEDGVPDKVITVSDDNVSVPHNVTIALQNITSTPDNMTTCLTNTENITDTLDKTIVDSTNDSDETAIPGVATAVSSNATDVLNDTITNNVPAPEPEQGQGLTSVLLQTKDIESEKDPSEPMPDALPKKVNSVLKHRCKLCNKEFKGGNIMRHAVSHLQKAVLQCMFCSKLFNRRLIAKRHVEEHVEKLRLEHGSNPSLAPENGTSETLECVRQSLSRNAKHKKRSAANTDSPSNNRKFNKLKVLQKLEEVKDSNSIKDKGTALKANGSILEGDLESGKEEHCCPADGCKRTFVRKGMSMIRHAVTSHPKDIKVQEFAFNWRKGKCEFCQRRFWSFLHYQDHIKRHDHPLKHVCLHLDCKNRFKTRAELRGHMKNHQPLRAQCSFANCSQIFCRISQLQDHEWRHYPVPDTKDDSVLMQRKVGRPVRRKRKDSQDASSHSCKILREAEKLEPAVPDAGDANDAATDTTEAKEVNEMVAETNASEKPVASEAVRTAEVGSSDRQIVNGHSENVVLIQTKAISPRVSGQETQVEVRSEDKKVEPKASHENPAVQGCKKVKESERSAYGGTSNRPFVRPPPSAYLDERYISMPKRRKSLPVDSRSSSEQSNFSCEAQRQRCSKCFSSFNSAEDLQSHLSLNKCTSLFGFDSDEESAW